MGAISHGNQIEHDTIFPHPKSFELRRSELLLDESGDGYSLVEAAA